MDDATMAQRLFGDTSQTEQAATTPEPTTDQKAAAILFAPDPEVKPAEVPIDIAKLRADDPDRQMFDAQSTHGDVPLEAAFAGIGGVADDVKAQAAGEWREIAVDVGLSSPEAKEVLGEFQQALANPPTAETRKAWVGEAKRQLLDKYGSDAPRVLADAKRLATRDPRVASLLDRSGLGDSPAMVMRLAELAMRQRGKGRL